MLQGFLQGFKELTFPDNCLCCRKYLNSAHQQQLCGTCLSSIKLNVPPFCLRCSRHLITFNEQGLCTSCLKTAYSFDMAWSACAYEPPLTDLIHAFKYNGKTHLRKTFNQLLISFIDTYHVPLANFDMILPLPLHPVKQRERGFNQAQLLAQGIAKQYHLPLKTDILLRVKHTASQTTLHEAKQRWTNVDEAFRINHPSDIADKNIFIVDDLLTTAATAHAASNALKNAGAAYIGVLTLAITP